MRKAILEQTAAPDSRAPPLESVIDVSEIDAVLQRAAEEDRLHSALAAYACAHDAQLQFAVLVLITAANEPREGRPAEEEMAARGVRCAAARWSPAPGPPPHRRRHFVRDKLASSGQRVVQVRSRFSLTSGSFFGAMWICQ